MILSVLSPTENQSRDLFEKSKNRCFTSPHVMHVHLTWIINPNELYYITQLLFLFYFFFIVTLRMKQKLESSRLKLDRTTTMTKQKRRASSEKQLKSVKDQTYY